MDTEFTVFSKPQCTFCEQAKGLLTAKGLSFTVHDIVADPPQREVMFALVEEATNRAPKTIPQIFHGEKYIGGYQELAQYLNN